MKLINELREMFNVEGVIGPFDTLIQNKGLAPNPFETFKDFILHIYKGDVDRKTEIKKNDEIINKLQESISENTPALKKKLSEADYDKNEQKIS